jgi:hypothetical protein
MNRKTQSVIGLSFFLLILPVLTFFILRMGFEYRRSSLMLLEDLSLLDSASIVTFLEKEVSISSSLFLWSSLGKENMASLNKIFHQFKNREEVYFLLDTSYLNPSIKDTFSLFDTDSKQVFLGQFMPHNFVLDTFTFANYPSYFLYFGDHSGYLRKIYDPGSNAEMGKLIEHLAMRIKAPERKKIIFQRESEK